MEWEDKVAGSEMQPELATSSRAQGAPSRPPGRGGVGVLTAANYFAQATRFALSIIVAQIFGPVGRGGVALISVLDEASTVLFSFGVPPAAGFYAKVGENTDAELMNAGARIGLLTLALTIPAGLLIGLLALQSLEPEARWLTILLIAWTGVVNLPGLVAMNILQAHRYLHGLAVYNVLFGLVTILVVVLLAILGHLTIAGVALGFVLGRAATAVYGIARTAWPRLRAPAAPLSAQLRYGTRALPGTVGMLLNNRFDQLLIAPLVDLRALGLYAVAAGTSFLPTILATSVASASFSTIEHDAHLGRRSSVSAAIRRGLIVSAIGALGLAVTSPVLIPLLYGSAFRPAIVPTVILLVGSIPWGGQIVARQCCNALGHPSFASFGELVGLAITVTGLLIFVPLFGILGAAAVSLAAYTVRFSVTLVLLHRTGIGHFAPSTDDLLWLWAKLMHVLSSGLFRR
jgi:O-antigen/teichoic acid export membrane protein